MTSQVPRRNGAACIIVNIDRERAFWRQQYRQLPCAQAQQGFEACWALLLGAYHVYLHHPHAGREVGAVMFANSPEAMAQRVEASVARRVFEQVMDRISRATTRLEYPLAVGA